MRLMRTRHWLLTALLTPTPIPPAPEAEQPTYTVQRGTVTRSLEFTARVAPVQQSDSPNLTAVLAEDARL